MKDKLGQELKVGDWVLSAKKGPYLNFGKIMSVDSEPREGVTVEEYCQKENNPKNPYESRRQTVNSPHTIV
jgi:hypothetical protein